MLTTSRKAAHARLHARAWPHPAYLRVGRRRARARAREEERFVFRFEYDSLGRFFQDKRLLSAVSVSSRRTARIAYAPFTSHAHTHTRMEDDAAEARIAILAILAVQARRHVCCLASGGISVTVNYARKIRMEK